MATRLGRGCPGSLTQKSRNWQKKKKDTKALEPPGTHTSTGKNVNQNRNTEIINKRGGKKSGKIFSFTK